jgi:HAD superfamily hydrolase (TIGR01490 family)
VTNAAAFFDLDRTLIRRSSVLALAGTFRERGLISRLDLMKSAWLQLLFAARGASAERVRFAAEDGMRLLAGFSVADLQRLVGDAMEPVLRPLVYAEPLRLVQQHRERGERVYIVSATLQEIVQQIADDLDFDGAVGSTCEVVDGRYTGVSLRAAHGEGKAQAVRELAEAEGLELAACTAYSDSHTDVPFLDVVGHPVVVNPDKGLRRTARERGWPVLEFSEHLVPSPARRIGPRAIAAAALVAGLWRTARRHAS